MSQPTDEIKEYYADLLISQYTNKERARATIKFLAGLMVMDQIPLDVENAYDIDTAVGDQLDILGKYIGAFRTNYTEAGYVVLDDSDYRQLLKLVLIKNNSGSSLGAIQELLAAHFEGLIRISDSGAMALNYVIAEGFGSDELLAILTDGRYLPAPMGVQTSVVIVPDIDHAYFGFRTYTDAGNNIAPFNFYDFYNLDYTWLSYQTLISTTRLIDQSGNEITQQDGEGILL